MILVVFYTILLIYVLFISAFIYGFGKIKTQSKININPKTSFFYCCSF